MVFFEKQKIKTGLMSMYLHTILLPAEMMSDFIIYSTAPKQLKGYFTINSK